MLERFGSRATAANFLAGKAPFDDYHACRSIAHLNSSSVSPGFFTMLQSTPLYHTCQSFPCAPANRAVCRAPLYCRRISCCNERLYTPSLSHHTVGESPLDQRIVKTCFLTDEVLLFNRPRVGMRCRRSTGTMTTLCHLFACFLPSVRHLQRQVAEQLTLNDLADLQ